MAGLIYQQALTTSFNVAVGDTNPVQIGGSLQGTVALEATNEGNGDCYVLAVRDGTTPTAANVTTNGQIFPSGGGFSRQGGIQSLGGGSVTPAFWVCCLSGVSTVVAGEEST